MVKIKVDDEIIHSPIRAKIRLDYQAEGKQRSFLFGGKNIERLAEETREQKVAMLRNIPIQGITIEDVDVSLGVYNVFDENTQIETTYAPVLITITSETFEDIVKFVMRSEFRKIEIIEPENMIFSRFDVERILFRINEELHIFKRQFERKFKQ